jgi:hypothetical protein
MAQAMIRPILVAAITLAAAVPATAKYLRLIGAIGGATITMTGDSDFANVLRCDGRCRL